MVGITKLDGVTLEDLKQPWKQVTPAELLDTSSPAVTTEAGSASEAPRAP